MNNTDFIIDDLNQTITIKLSAFTFQQDSLGLYLSSWNLKYVHEYAVAINTDYEVVYPCFTNNEIRVVINTGYSVKLGKKTDFNHQTFIISNTDSNLNNIFLFELSNEAASLGNRVSRKDVDSGKYHHIEELSNNLVLLYIADNHFWTYREAPNDTGNKYRKDILLIENGVSKNDPIAPYLTNGTKLSCYYCNTSSDQKSIKNLHVKRIRGNSSQMEQVTNLIKVNYQNNVLFENIFVEFYDGYGECYKNADRCFLITNSTNVFFKDVSIFGTYSFLNSYGYAISLDNVWNCIFDNLTGFGNWGVFGNNNVQKVFLKDCHLNRFDIHLYGADINSKNCLYEAATRDSLTRAYRHAMNDPSAQITIESSFSDTNANRINRFDNLYGEVVYDSCTFNDFYPFKVDSSYKIYTGCNVVFNECTINVGLNANSIVFFDSFNSLNSGRPENWERAWPNVFLNNTILKRLDTTSTELINFFIFKSNDHYYSNGQIEYLTMITLQFSTSSEFNYFCIFETNREGNQNFGTKNPLNRVIDGFTEVGPNVTPSSGLYIRSLNQ